MTRRRWLVWGPVIAVTWPAGTIPASAHLVQTGFGSFYDGMAHLVLTPTDLLLVVAAALLAGMRGTAAARRTLFVLPAAWLLGGILGSFLAASPSAGTLSWATSLTFGVLGALVALDARLPDSAVGGAAAVTGVLHGLLNGATLAGVGALGLAGVVTAVFVTVSLISARIVTLRAQWSRIAVRVAGSWIAAAGILMLGWLIKGSI